VDAKTLSSGAVLVLVGLLRKVVLADGVAAIVNRTFADPGAHTSLELLQGVFFFGVQIYGDFSGYSSIARGVARMLGIELMVNFRHPYLARNITDFWRRWHVSLSEWLRDYLYVPLGGSRCSSLMTYRNLMLTMLLGGLWHGAAWTFVVWGGMHGLGLAVHKLFRGREGAKRLDRPQGAAGYAGLAASWLLTMAFVWLAWIFFRAETFTGAAEVVEGMFAFRGPVEQKLLFDMAVATAVLLLIDVPQFVADEHTVFLRWPVPVRGAFYAFCTLAIVVYWSGGATPFIYFQF
jgi:D-alanyl-lipoteichoic acid acyltransferase DltB (MBOAT superfamily)